MQQYPEKGLKYADANMMAAASNSQFPAVGDKQKLQNSSFVCSCCSPSLPVKLHKTIVHNNQRSVASACEHPTTQESLIEASSELSKE